METYYRQKEPEQLQFMISDLYKMFLNVTQSFRHQAQQLGAKWQQNT